MRPAWQRRGVGGVCCVLLAVLTTSTLRTATAEAATVVSTLPWQCANTFLGAGDADWVWHRGPPFTSSVSRDTVSMHLPATGTAVGVVDVGTIHSALPAVSLVRAVSAQGEGPRVPSVVAVRTTMAAVTRVCRDFEGLGVGRASHVRCAVAPAGGVEAAFDLESVAALVGGVDAVVLHIGGVDELCAVSGDEAGWPAPLVACLAREVQAAAVAVGETPTTVVMTASALVLWPAGIVAVAAQLRQALAGTAVAVAGPSHTWQSTSKQALWVAATVNKQPSAASGRVSAGDGGVGAPPAAQSLSCDPSRHNGFWEVLPSSATDKPYYDYMTRTGPDHRHVVWRPFGRCALPAFADALKGASNSRRRAGRGVAPPPGACRRRRLPRPACR